MRQAINNLQATATAFGNVSKENVLKVCDIPNLDVMEEVIFNCMIGIIIFMFNYNYYICLFLQVILILLKGLYIPYGKRVIQLMIWYRLYTN